MHEEAAQTHVFKEPDLATQLVRFQLSVPGPERLASVDTRRVTEFLQPFGIHVLTPVTVILQVVGEGVRCTPSAAEETN